MLVHGVETVVVVGAPSRADGSFGACLLLTILTGTGDRVGV